MGLAHGWLRFVANQDGFSDEFYLLYIQAERPRWTAARQTSPTRCDPH